ncbi:MAG: hypothetical protein GX873_00390 [Parcubacteria group bacterium]|nr:hypothetical protein [Parcubacteria group bacterium]
MNKIFHNETLKSFTKKSLFVLTATLIVSSFFVFNAGKVEAQVSNTLVAPFETQTFGTGATAEWTNVDKHTGSYSVKLYSPANSYASVGTRAYVGTINDITSLSFWYKHSPYAAWVGPKMSLFLEKGGHYYRASTNCVVRSDTVWKKADAINGKDNDFYVNEENKNQILDYEENKDQIWNYVETQSDFITNIGTTVDNLTFNDLKIALTGANVKAVVVYVSAASKEGPGGAYIDDIEINGTTYYGKIQDAIDAATTGDTINVAAGMYNENLIVNKSLTLNGAKHGVTAVGRTGAESIIRAANSSVYVVKITADKVTLDGFTITGMANNGTNQAAVITWGVDSCTITNNILTNNYKDAINLFSVGTAYSDYNTVSNNVINGPNGVETFGIKIKGSHNTISGNHIYNTDTSIQIWSGDASETVSPDYNTISGNTIAQGIGGTAAHKWGIDIRTGHNNTVTGNTITGVEWAAINLYTSDKMASETGFDPRPANVTISNNTISGGEVGIALMEGARNNTISGNTIKETSVAGILGSLSRWPSNWSGKTLTYTNDTSYLNYLQIVGNTIKGNTISNCGHGIAMAYADNNILIENTIQNNKSTVAIDWHGVSFTADAAGVYFDANSSGNVANYNKITNNTGYSLKNANTAYNLDATKNWWGSAKPDFDTIVSNNVNYSPWYTNQEMTSLTAVIEEESGDDWVDFTAPSISDITLTVGDTNATISWKTDETSLSWIVYGTTNAYGLEKKTTSYVTSHSLTLSNLSPGTTYHYQIKSKDSAGNIGSYTDKTFTTLALNEKPKEIVKGGGGVIKPINQMTVEELKAEIARIMALIKQLQAELLKLKGCTITSFDRNLKLGMTSDDVKCLQIILNFAPDTQLTAFGVGSSGQETTYFGPLTKTAVIKFQEKYASEILAPVDLTAGTGFVGSTTRAKLNTFLGK